MKPTVVILQSNYIPWRGYFDLIRKADLFIFHDDLQYTKQDWRNRNRVKTKEGSAWLSIPVGKISTTKLIQDVEIQDYSWQKNHWARIQENYRDTPYFQLFSPFIKDFYLNNKWTNLSRMNQFFIKSVALEIMNLKSVSFLDSKNLGVPGQKKDKVLNLLKAVDAKKYISGPSAKSYLSEVDCSEIEVELEWMSYDHYDFYQQPHPPFDQYVSIIDAIFCCGKNAGLPV